MRWLFKKRLFQMLLLYILERPRCGGGDDLHANIVLQSSRYTRAASIETVSCHVSTLYEYANQSMDVMEMTTIMTIVKMTTILLDILLRRCHNANHDAPDMGINAIFFSCPQT
jgi:hypothetical protein